MPNQPLTYSDALDTIFGMVNTAWQNATSFLGYTPMLKWQGNEEPAQPLADKVWARVSAQIITDRQAAFANSNGQRLYHAKGLLYVQLFIPRTSNDLQLAKQFAQYIQNVFLSASPDGNVWFTNPRIVELAPTDANYPINFSVNYEYDHLSDLNNNITPLIPALINRGKHFPVEAKDGVRTAFTFVGIPIDSNFSLVLLNGVGQDGFTQQGQVIDFGIGNAPKPGDSLYALY